MWNEEWKNSRPIKLHEIWNNTTDFNPTLTFSRKY